MADTVEIRVTRTWNARVPAVFGDTEETLKAKVTEEYLDATPPDDENRVLMPDSLTREG